MATVVATRNRQIRQEALREFLSKQKLVEHVFDLAKKIETLEPQQIEVEGKNGSIYLMDAADFELKKYKASAELNLKLINKYLPDVKQVEIDQTIHDRRAEQLSDAELEDIAAGRSIRVTEAPDSQEEPPSVH